MEKTLTGRGSDVNVCVLERPIRAQLMLVQPGYLARQGIYDNYMHLFSRKSFKCQIVFKMKTCTVAKFTVHDLREKLTPSKGCRAGPSGHIGWSQQYSLFRDCKFSYWTHLGKFGKKLMNFKLVWHSIVQCPVE